MTLPEAIVYLLPSIFPKFFDEATIESYQESQETFSKLFEDNEKYVAIMTAIGEMLFAERKNAAV